MARMRRTRRWRARNASLLFFILLYFYYLGGPAHTHGCRIFRDRPRWPATPGGGGRDSAPRDYRINRSTVAYVRPIIVAVVNSRCVVYCVKLIYRDISATRRLCYYARYSGATRQVFPRPNDFRQHRDRVPVIIVKRGFDWSLEFAICDSQETANFKYKYRKALNKRDNS